MPLCIYGGVGVIDKTHISYDVAIIQWIMLCHKNRMTTHEITLWGVQVTSLTMSVSAMCFLVEIMIIVKAIKYHLKKESYDKQNLTLLVILYEMTAHVRSSIFVLPVYWTFSLPLSENVIKRKGVIVVVFKTSDLFPLFRLAIVIMAFYFRMFLLEKNCHSEKTRHIFFISKN